MIIGVGTDMVDIARIAALLESQGDRFLHKCYTRSERTEGTSLSHPHRRASYYAKRFAAKEAVAKALGCGIGEQIGWQDMEVTRSALGAPRVTLLTSDFSDYHVHLSLSDERQYALAFAVVEDKGITSHG